MNIRYSLIFKKKYYNSDLENQMVFRQTGSVFLLCRAVSPVFVGWNNAMCHYVHNLQGDAVGIVDLNGTDVVKYRYDPWSDDLPPLVCWQ